MAAPLKNSSNKTKQDEKILKIFRFEGLFLKKFTSFQACVSQKTRKLYGPEKPFVTLRPAYFVKLVFSYVVKGIKIKITAKFRDTEHLRFEDAKRIMSTEKA